MKRGEMPIEYIAAFILALAVLVFAIMYFSSIRTAAVDAIKNFFEGFL